LHVLKDLASQLVQVHIAFPRELGKSLLVKVVANWLLVCQVALFDLELEIVQTGYVVSLFHSVAPFAHNVGQTAALAGLLVAVVVQRGARLAIARLAAKQAVSLQVEEAILALVAKQRVHEQFAMALARHLVAHVQLVDGAVSVAGARRTALLRVRAQVVEAVLALLALVAFHVLFAGANDLWQVPQVLGTARERGRRAKWVAFAALAHRIVVKVVGTLGTLDALEVGLAVAFARVGVT
jgi:hypothetical protein